MTENNVNTGSEDQFILSVVKQYMLINGMSSWDLADELLDLASQQIDSRREHYQSIYREIKASQHPLSTAHS